MDGCYNPSWVVDRLNLAETEEPCAIKRMHKAQEEVRQCLEDA